MVISRTIIRWRTIQTLTKINNPDPVKGISKHCGPYGQALNCNNNSYLSFAWFGIRYVVSGVLNAAVQSLPHWRSQQLILQLKKREALALFQLQMHSLNHLQISRPRTRVQIHTDGVPGITALLQLRLKTDQRRVTKNWNRTHSLQNCTMTHKINELNQIMACKMNNLSSNTLPAAHSDCIFQDKAIESPCLQILTNPHLTYPVAYSAPPNPISIPP